MKKFLLFFALCIFSVQTFGQISVQKTQRDGEIILQSGNGYIYHNLTSDNYYLCVKSDNQYESKQISIKLGNGKEEAIKSIIAIEDLWENCKNGDVIEIDATKCTVYKGMMFYLQFDNPPHTAGSYFIGCEFNTKLGLLDKAIKKYNKGKF